MLQSKSILTDNLFRAKANFCIFNNNSNEIIGQRQQGEVLTSIWGECVDLVQDASYDKMKLGR